MRALLLALALAACASTVAYTRAPAACQAQAVNLAWRVSFGRTDHAPDIWWVPRAAQTCGRVFPGGARGFIGSGGQCVGGQSWIDGMDLVDFGGGWPATALCHESQHVADARDGRPPDFFHAGPGFQPGGTVERCNARLAAAGICGP